MSCLHTDLPADRWQTLSLMEQLANVGSDVASAHRRQGEDAALSDKALIRALELLRLTIGDTRWKGRREKLTRTRELFCDAMAGGSAYNSDLASLDRYLLHFAVAARADR